MKNIFALIIALSFVFTANVSAQAIPTLDFFHGQECPHCHKEKKWFPKLKEAYPDVVINEYEVWHDAENSVLAEARLKELGEEFKGVPANIIGGEKFVSGFGPEAILAAFEELYGAPAVEITVEAEESSWFTRLLETILSWFGV